MLRVHLLAALLCCHVHAARKQPPLDVLALALVFSGPVWADLPGWLEWSTAGCGGLRGGNSVAARPATPAKITTVTVTAVAALVLVAEALSGTSWLAAGFAGPPLLIELWSIGKQPQKKASTPLYNFPQHRKHHLQHKQRNEDLGNTYPTPSPRTVSVKPVEFVLQFGAVQSKHEPNWPGGVACTSSTPRHRW